MPPSDMTYPSVSHSISCFPGLRTSASVTIAKENFQACLIEFLSTVQRCKIDFLPITWQEGLGILGRGGSGQISQAPVRRGIGIAFKRFHTQGPITALYKAMISEVLILSQPPIRGHPNIVNLEGVCWEIDSETDEATPVLVFEKATWDLQEYMRVTEGATMSLSERLEHCVDVGSAIKAMHAYNIIHGDIKPENVLVFKSSKGRGTFKMSDFGYSTLTTNEEDIISLPCSPPWNAPEIHHRGFSLARAKMADIYSFGLLCLWILFKDDPLNLEDITTPAACENVNSLDQLIREKFLIAYLKKNNMMVGIADKLVQQSDLPTEDQLSLKKFFITMLSFDPEQRNCDLEELIKYINPGWNSPLAANSRESFEVSASATQRDFRICMDLVPFMMSDYRVRRTIKSNLERSHEKEKREEYAKAIAFQLAYCYQIGFGTSLDHESCLIWLEASGKGLADLNAEKWLVGRHWSNQNLEKFVEAGGFYILNPGAEYLAWGRRKLREAQQICTQEVEDLESEFGEHHTICLTAKRSLATIHDELANYEEAKELRRKFYEHVLVHYEVSHPYYYLATRDMVISYRKTDDWASAITMLVSQLSRMIGSIGLDHLKTLSVMEELVWAYRKQGQYTMAEELGMCIVKIRDDRLGQDHADTLSSIESLALTHRDQGRLNDAEKLLVQVLEIRKETLGLQHRETLMSMGNLALIYLDWGLWTKAEELAAQAIKIQETVLGREHPETLTTMANLGSIYDKQGKWTEAKSLQKTITDIRKRILGAKHPDTLTSMNNLAWTYLNNGQITKAKDLFLKVMEVQESFLGLDHPDTLITMDNLSCTYYEEGRLDEAAEKGARALELRKMVLGDRNLDTITSMGNLASTYNALGRWSEAETLRQQVLEVHKMVLGRNHPDVFISMGNLASTYSSQGRLAEAERLRLQVFKGQKSILGERHPDTLVSMANLATTYFSLEKWTEAERLMRACLEMRTDILGQDHPSTLNCMVTLSAIYHAQKRWAEAERLGLQAIKIQTRVLGPQHQGTLRSEENLACTFSEQGRLAEAEELRLRILEKQQRTFGPAHQHTLTAMENLASTYDKQGRTDEAKELENQIYQLTKDSSKPDP